MHKESIIPSNIHHVTSQISSQQKAMNTHNGGNNSELVQNFDEVVLTWQLWWSTTPNYFRPKISASTPTTIFVRLQDIGLNFNIDLMTID